MSVSWVDGPFSAPNSITKAITEAVSIEDASARVNIAEINDVLNRSFRDLWYLFGDIRKEAKRLEDVEDRAEDRAVRRKAMEAGSAVALVQEAVETVLKTIEEVQADLKRIEGLE